MATFPRIGMIGYGAIGRELGEVLVRLEERSQLVAVLVRPGRAAGAFKAVNTPMDLLVSGAQLVLECAGHDAVLEYGPAILAAGADLVLTSVGALAAPGAIEPLQSAAAGRARLLMAPGAIGGLDGLLAARLGGLTRVTYTSMKPPEAWRGTIAETQFDLNDPSPEQVLFEGSAREAAANFPKNANVALAVAICGVGFDKTQVRLVSSRQITDPLGVIEAEGACGRFRFESFAYASPSNSKTSLLTAYSLLQCARLGLGLPIFALLEGVDTR